MDGAMMQLNQDALAQLMPMSLRVTPEGVISYAGPTLAKICPELPLKGRHVLEVFEIKRPRGAQALTRLLSETGGQVHLMFIGPSPQTALRGVWARTDDGGAVVNLSFGIGVVEAVAKYDLTLADFAPTDLAVEMLYLVEAKSAVSEELNSLMQRLEGARINAEERAFTDTLTGLKNRRAMDFVLDGLIRAGRKFTLMHIDLDFFKQVNDTHGHAAGDHVLEHVSRILRQQTRDDDVAVRVGGDEFLLILPDRIARDDVVTLAQRLIAAMEHPIPFGDVVCRISASIGIAQSTLYDTPDADRILADTDTATYASKHAGRAQATMFEDLEPTTNHRAG